MTSRPAQRRRANCAHQTVRHSDVADSVEAGLGIHDTAADDHPVKMFVPRGISLRCAWRRQRSARGNQQGGAPHYIRVVTSCFTLTNLLVSCTQCYTSIPCNSNHEQFYSELPTHQGSRMMIQIRPPAPSLMGNGVPIRPPAIARTPAVSPEYSTIRRRPDHSCRPLDTVVRRCVLNRSLGCGATQPSCSCRLAAISGVAPSGIERPRVS